MDGIRGVGSQNNQVSSQFKTQNTQETQGADKTNAVQGANQAQPSNQTEQTHAVQPTDKSHLSEEASAELNGGAGQQPQLGLNLGALTGNESKDKGSDGVQAVGGADKAQSAAGPQGAQGTDKPQGLDGAQDTDKQKTTAGSVSGIQGAKDDGAKV